MNKTISKHWAIFIGVLSLVFLTQAGTASAFYVEGHYYDRGHQHYDRDHHNRHNRKHRKYRKHWKYQKHARKHSYVKYYKDVHYGHKHGPLVELPYWARIILVGGLEYYSHRGDYYKKSACGYHAVQNPHSKRRGSRGKICRFHK